MVSDLGPRTTRRGVWYGNRSRPSGKCVPFSGLSSATYWTWNSLIFSQPQLEHTQNERIHEIHSVAIPNLQAPRQSFLQRASDLAFEDSRASFTRKRLDNTLGPWAIPPVALQTDLDPTDQCSPLLWLILNQLKNSQNGSQSF